MTGSEFKALRNKYGLSQNEVARLLRIKTDRTIRNIEADGPTPTTADHWLKTVRLYELTGKWEIEK